MHGGTMRFESAMEQPDDPLSPHGTKVIVSFRTGSDHLPPESVNLPIGELQGNPLKQFHQSVMEDLAHCQWGWVGSAVGPDPEASFVNALLGSTKEVIPTASSSIYINPTDVIFIVEDEIETRRYLREIFQSFCKVVECTTGEEALEKTKTTLPDLIIADAVLPQVSGLAHYNSSHPDVRLRDGRELAPGHASPADVACDPPHGTARFFARDGLRCRR